MLLEFEYTAISSHLLISLQYRSKYDPQIQLPPVHETKWMLLMNWTGEKEKWKHGKLTLKKTKAF